MKKIISNISNKILKINNSVNQIYLDNRNKHFIFLNIPFEVKLLRTQETRLFNLLIKDFDKKKYFLIKLKYDPYLSSRNMNKNLMLSRFKKFLKINNINFLSIENSRLVALPVEIYAMILKFKCGKGQITSAFFSLSKILNVKILNTYIIPKLFDFIFKNSNESKLLYIILFKKYYQNMNLSKIDL